MRTMSIALGRTGFGATIASVSCLIGVLVLPNCGPTNPSGPEQPTEDPISVGVAYALGGKGDQSYNDAVHLGVLELRDAGVVVDEFEPTNLGDFPAGVSALSLRQPDLVFCVGYLYDEHIEAIAERNPTVQYVILDGFSSGPNYSSVKFNSTQGSRLAGVLAAMLSESGVIAFVGGTDIPIINEFRDGFARGAESIQPDIEVLWMYVGTGATAFTDPVAGREVALTAIGRGADVIYHAAGTSGNGIIKAADEQGIAAIGIDVDQSHLAPGTVKASMIKDFGRAMGYVIERFEAGEAVGGQEIALGLAEEGVYLGFFSADVPPAAQEAVDNARRTIAAEGR